VAGVRRILVACDFSPESSAVMTMAASLAIAIGAKIRLVHAIQAPLDEEIVDPTTGPYEKVQQELQSRVQRRLEDLFADKSAAGVPADAAVLPGNPADQIPHQARRWGADLIVVGVRHIGKVQKYFRGSTTEALLRKAPCSVLAVPASRASASDFPSGTDEPSPERRGS
jgi:nucleotide-binding universal stress UspA family protein